MSYYEITSERNSEKYIKLNKEIEILEKGCAYSEFQYLDHTPMKCTISDDSGVDYPDFLQYGNIPLISNKFRQVLNDIGVDNLFYKPVMVVDELLGERNQYYLALPPAIDCLDIDKSECDEYLDGVNKIPDLPMVNLRKIVVKSDNIGNYKIFKVIGVIHSGIYINDEVKMVIQKNNLTNIFFYEVEEI